MSGSVSCYPISSYDFRSKKSTYTYQLDLETFDLASCTMKASDLVSGISAYNINIILLDGYDWKQYSMHLDIINDTTGTTDVPINISFTSITGEQIYGFETMPLTFSFPAAGQVKSRYFLFYYNPTIKYWFCPLY